MYRYYVDRATQTGGKSACIGAFIPADAMDAWVIGKVKAALLGDHETAAEAVDEFVKQVLAGQDKPSDTTGAEKELEAVNKRIKAMVGMLADPSFDGLDELKTTLATLNAKRDDLHKAPESSRRSNVHLKESDILAMGQCPPGATGQAPGQTDNHRGGEGPGPLGGYSNRNRPHDTDGHPLRAAGHLRRTHTRTFHYRHSPRIAFVPQDLMRSACGRFALLLNFVKPCDLCGGFFLIVRAGELDLLVQHRL